MAEMIKVLVVADAAGSEWHANEAREALEHEPGFEVVAVTIGGTSAAGVAGVHEVLDQLPLARPDVVLVDLDVPGVDGLGLTEAIASRFPWVSVIALAAQSDPEFIRRVGLAGARHLVVKPFTAAELVRAARQVYHLDASRRASHAASVATARQTRAGQLFAFYAAKGGLGCTTLACNVAVALKHLTGKEVALFDCGLLFGDVAVLLNLDPRQQTIVDLLPILGGPTGHAASSALDPETLNQLLVPHISGVKVLLAPPSPEKSEVVAPRHVRAVLAALREQFDYVIIDTWPTFEERMLHVLDAADKIIVPTTLELPAIKNTKLLLDVVGALGHRTDKVQLVLNRVGSRVGVRVQDVEESLAQPAVAKVASDWRLTTLAVNKGVPFVMSHPDAPLSADVTDLARTLAGSETTAAEAARSRRGGLLRVVFGT